MLTIEKINLKKKIKCLRVSIPTILGRYYTTQMPQLGLVTYSCLDHFIVEPYATPLMPFKVPLVPDTCGMFDSILFNN